jgi:hypothetical protein
MNRISLNKKSPRVECAHGLIKSSNSSADTDPVDCTRVSCNTTTAGFSNLGQTVVGVGNVGLEADSWDTDDKRCNKQSLACNLEPAGRNSYIA